MLCCCVCLLFEVVAHFYLVVDNSAAGSCSSLAAWSVSYSVLYSLLWSLFLCWLCCAVFFRLLPDGLLLFMEWRIWSVLGKLGFGIYLVHPVIPHARE
jgi:peptidoglycan/LPS O-acetylase OafA/YrhL